MSEGQPSEKGFYIRQGRRLYAERWGSGERGAGPTVVLEVGSLTVGTEDAGWRPIREAITAELDFSSMTRPGWGRATGRHGRARWRRLPPICARC